MRRLAAAFALSAAVLAGPARAAPAHPQSTACWVDHGAVIVSAAFGDIAGDFLLDLAAPKSQLLVDAALEHGIETPTTTATLRLGRARIPATLALANLDARTRGFPTTLTGLIGADVLASYGVDLQLSPCRLTLWRRRAPRFQALARLPLRMVGGVPAVGASVSDGAAGLEGSFAIDTGGTGVRLSQSVAHLSRAPAKGVDPGSRITPPARLAALSVGGQVWRALPAGVTSDLAPGLMGAIGTQVWSGYVLRLDPARSTLELAPISARRSARSPGSSRRAAPRTG